MCEQYVPPQYVGGGGEGGLRGPSHPVWLRNLESFLEEVRFQQGFRRMGISCPSEMQGSDSMFMCIFLPTKYSLFYLLVKNPSTEFLQVLLLS